MTDFETITDSTKETRWYYFCSTSQIMTMRCKQYNPENNNMKLWAMYTSCSLYFQTSAAFYASAAEYEQISVNKN